MQVVSPWVAARAAVARWCLVLVLGGTLRAAEAPVWETLVAQPGSAPEQLALIDLQRYLGQVLGRIPRVVSPSAWRVRPTPAVLLGTPAANPNLTEFPLDLAGLPAEGYVLASMRFGADQLPIVVAAAPQSPGAVQAIYGLLRELGFGFFLGSEFVPARLPAGIPDGAPRRRVPVFAVRGVLPWYNFFNSPTVWDPIDHRAFVDQLVRMGANFVGFHTYDQEPFAAFPGPEGLERGGRLLNTREATWGTHPRPTSQFAFGTHRLFADDAFGAASTHWTLSTEEAIRGEQAVLREALRYARARGLQTCLGFEISGDPTQPADRDRFQRRFRHLLEVYPMLDYVWLWQPETQGAQGFAERYHQHGLPDRHRPGSHLEAYGQARRDVFRRIVERTAGERPFLQTTPEGQAARAREGARLEQFAHLALRLLALHVSEPHDAHRRAAGVGSAGEAARPRLILAGWGGDERLLSAEYYEGLDRLLPTNVVFASLDHIAPRSRVDRIYGELPKERMRWPIPWLENDGDQWQPQPYVKVYEALIRDAHAAGAQGWLGIHWRTRDLEENLAFLVDYAWQPGLKAAGFFQDYARRAYPAEMAEEMAIIHQELDALGYRWVGGGGQNECAPFSWGPGSSDRRASLEALRERLRRMASRAGSAVPRLEWLRRVVEWSLAYHRAETAAVTARALLDQGKAEEARQLLEAGALAEAVRAYATRVTTRGEYGVLATINAKAVVAWEQLWQEAHQRLGREPAPPLPGRDWSPPPQILLPRFLGSTSAGQPLDVEPIVLGGQPAWLHYRTLGTTRWRTLRLEEVRGWVCRARVPAAEVEPPGLEFACSFSADPAPPAALGPLALSVFPVGDLDWRRQEPAPPGEVPALAPVARAGQAHALELTWHPCPAADHFQVERDGVWLTDTAVPFLPDDPPAAERPAVYRITGWRGPHQLAAAEIRATAAELQVDAPVFADQIRVTAEVRRGGVRLAWPAVASPRVYAFEVRQREAARATGGGPAVARLVAARRLPHEVVVTPAAGRWHYDVVALCRGQASPVVGELTGTWPPATAQVVQHWDLRARPAEVQQIGEVTWGPDGAGFGAGHLEFRPAPGFDPGWGLTLTFAFRADRTDGMPVLLAHGIWQVDGWYVQILGGQLIVRTTDGDATGPAIRAGEWYQVRWDFDGWQHRLAVNGRETSPAVRVTPTAAARPLIVGQYQHPAPEFAFQGVIRDLRLESTLPSSVSETRTP